MTDAFYREFEANFRGSREEITGRLGVYRPFLTPFLELEGEPRLIDLGCGRGEWLELTQSIGFSVYGVDLDDGMLEDCFARNLPAENADAIRFLKSLADGSQSVVSGFHIAEHLPFDVLQALIAEAHRVLRPGGLLILETPNAENINVGTLSFHMDPTHNKPLPPGLLSFLPRFHGFLRDKVLRLQEDPLLLRDEAVALIEVFRGVSPDYAVIAQKAGDAAFLAKFEALFQADYGLTLETLTRRFERGVHDRIDDLAQRSHDRIEELTQSYHHLDAMLLATQEQIGDLSRQNADYLEQLIAVHDSTSWRITRPLRSARRILDLRLTVRRRFKNGVAAVLRWLMLLVLSKSWLRAPSLRLVKRFPTATARLRRLLFRTAGELPNESFRHRMIEQQLSPKARLIYAKLIARRGE